jgi:hypothetical protein
VDPLLEPGNGPNYFPFDPDIRYSIKIDNDNDAVEDATHWQWPPAARCFDSCAMIRRMNALNN